MRIPLTILLVTLGVLLALSAAAMWIAAVWLHSREWGLTGFIVLILGIIITGAGGWVWETFPKRNEADE